MSYLSAHFSVFLCPADIKITLLFSFSQILKQVQVPFRLCTLITLSCLYLEF